MATIEATALTKTSAQTGALEDLSFEGHEGEMVANDSMYNEAKTAVLEAIEGPCPEIEDVSTEDASLEDGFYSRTEGRA